MVTSRPVIGQLFVLFWCNTGHGYVQASDWSVVCFAVIWDMITSKPVIGHLLVLFCCNIGRGYVSASDWSVTCFVLL